MAFPVAPVNNQTYTDPVTGLRYVYNSATNAWVRASTEDGSNIVPTAYAGVPPAKDTLYVDGSLNQFSPQTFQKLQAYDSVAGLYSDLLVQRSLRDVSSSRIISAGGNYDFLFNERVYVTATSGNIRLFDGYYNGQTVTFIRAADWSSTQPTFSAVANPIQYVPGTPSISGNQISEITFNWNSATSTWERGVVIMSAPDANGDQQSAAAAPSFRSTGSTLQGSDIWYSSTRKDTKIYDGGAGDWVDINEPATVLNVGGSHTTTRSENIVCTAPGATVNLNATPEPGEKVGVWLGDGGTCVVNGPMELGVTAVALSNTLVKRATFIYDSNVSKWIWEYVARTSPRIPSYSEGTLAARPVSGFADGDLYRVTGDTVENNGRTFAWDIGLNSWREIGSDMFASGLLAARPAAPLDGFMYYATDTTFSYVYDAASATWRTVGGPAGLDSGDYGARPVSTTSDSLFLADELSFMSYYRSKVFFYDQSAASWREVGPAAMKAWSVNSGATQTVNNQYVHLLVNTTAGPCTINLPTSPDEGQYYRVISGNRGTNNVSINGNGKTFSTGGVTFSMTPQMQAVTFVYDLTNNVWHVHVEGAERMTVSDTAPAVATKVKGDFWWDSANLELYVLHDDGVTKAWVASSGSGGPLTAPVQVVAGGVVDCSLGNFYSLALSANTTMSFTNPPASGSAYIATVQVASTAGTLSYPAAVKWPGGIMPTLTAGKTHVLTFMTYDGGVSWIANALTEY